jgi:hypothetical protein
MADVDQLASAAAASQPSQAHIEIQQIEANMGEEVHNQIFEVGPRYSKLTYIGEGAYGMVV